MKEVLPWMVRFARRADKRDFYSALSVQNILFLTVHYLNSYVLIDLQAGQEAVLGRLALSMCLWFIATQPQFVNLISHLS